jgi:hypothetical protein
MSHVSDDGSIVTVSPPRELTDEVVVAVLRDLEARLARGGSYGLIFDLSKAGTPNAVQRQLLAAHMRKNRALIERNVRRLAVVAPSSLVRGVLTAIFWIEPPPVPYEVFGSRNEAIAWALASGAAKARP